MKAVIRLVIGVGSQR